MGTHFQILFNIVETDTNLKQNKITKAVWLQKNSLKEYQNQLDFIVKDGI